MYSKRYLRPRLFVAPGISVLLAVIALPIISAFLYSLREVLLHRFRRQVFVGMENYRFLFRDPLFVSSVRVTFLYMFGVTVISVAFGLVIAVVLNQRNIRFKSYFIAIFVTPFIMTPVVVGLAWRLFIWQSEFGLINELLGMLGIQGRNWLVDRQTALTAAVITNAWRLIPLCILIFYAALSTIPEEIIESAVMDGVGPTRLLLKITLPLIRVHFVFVTLIILTSAFREFDSIYSLTGGGPGRATTVLSVLVYNRGIANADMGYANAIAFTMFAMIAIVCTLYLRLSREDSTM